MSLKELFSKTVLRQWIEEGHVTTAKLDSLKLLHQGAREGDLENVKYLISKGANSDYVDDLGDTPLIAAAQNNQIEIINFLITEAKVNIDHQGASKKTALHWAAEKGYLKLVALLIKHKANVTLADQGTQTALFYALLPYSPENNNLPIATLLIRAGSPITHDRLGNLLDFFIPRSDQKNALRASQTEDIKISSDSVSISPTVRLKR